MCGRDTFFATWAQVREFSLPLAVTTPEAEPQACYNRAPTQDGWVLRAGDDGVAVDALRWGLIPFWAKDAKLAYSTINARVESADSKPAFREAWKKRRCLVPSSGYYEWQVLADGKSKQPWFIHADDAPLLMFAGLWERWKGPDGDVESYSIVTRPAAGAITRVHDRMPLILQPAAYEPWLRGSGDDASAIAASVPTPKLAFHPVGKAVGNVRSQGEQLIRPLAIEKAAAQPSGQLF